MHKPQRTGMQRLTGHELKGTFHKGPVSSRVLAHANAVAAIGSIGEQRMAEVLHVCPNLVGTARLEHTPYQGDRAKAFQHLVVRHGRLALLPARIHSLYLAVAQAAPNMAFDGAH